MGNAFVARNALLIIAVFAATLAEITAVPANDIFSDWPTVSAPSCRSEPRRRKSVFRKPRPIASSCVTCRMSGASCLDFNQLVKQMKSIEINIDHSTKVTNIDKSIQEIKLGLDSLLKLNGSLPKIEGAFFQNNVALLPSIELKLKNIESGSAGISGGVTKINENLATLPEIKKTLDGIQTTIRQIEANRGDLKPQGPAVPPDPAVERILSCFKQSGHVYFMGPFLSGQKFERCMDKGEWQKSMASYTGAAGNFPMGSLAERAKLCRAPKKGPADTSDEALSADLLTQLLTATKTGPPHGIHLVGAMAYEPILIASIETNLPVTIEHGTFCENVRFEKSKIFRTLSLDGSFFLNDLTFTNSNLGEDFHLRNAVTRSVQFLSTSTISGTADLSGTVGARLWHFVGATIGQLDASNADLRDLDFTDTEFKRDLSLGGIRIRNTLALQRSIVGSDFDLTNARLTHTIIRRLIVKSDLHLTSVDARCSTKVHKSRIDGDVIVEDYHFGGVTIDGAAKPMAGDPQEGKFGWVVEKRKQLPNSLTEAQFKDFYPNVNENPGDENPYLETSSCTIITPAKKEEKLENIYRSSGVLDIVDSAVGGSICMDNVQWQRGFQNRLLSRYVESAQIFEPQNVVSFNGTSVAKYTILGTLKHDALSEGNPADRSAFSRLQLVGFKTNGLMLNQKRDEANNEYKKVVSQLDIQTVLKANADCQLDNIGFSRLKTRSNLLVGPAAASELSETERVPGAAFPTGTELLTWLRNVEPPTSQPHAAFIAALSRSGIDPVELRIAKSWADINTDWRLWWRESWRPADRHRFGYTSVIYNKTADALQLAVRWINGSISGFGLRPANSLIIAVGLILFIWLVLRSLYGRMAYLYVPADRIGNKAVVPLSTFKDFGNQWRVVTAPVIVSMMIPQAITSVPLLGGLFANITFDWTKNRIIGFRRAREVNPIELASDELGSVQPIPSFWDALSPIDAATTVPLPHRPEGLEHADVVIKRVKRLSGKTATEPGNGPPGNPVDTYVPGLLNMPESGSLLSFLGLSSWLGYVAAAVLVSGIITLLKF
jgi:hypothetical protein